MAGEKYLEEEGEGIIWVFIKFGQPTAGYNLAIYVWEAAKPV